jgi:peptidyl-prolyl cis-trans isomerase SurA
MKKQRKQMRLKFILISLGVIIGFNSYAQSEESESGVVVDKIIAKVDNYIILKSELERAYLDYLSRGEARGSDAKCQMLQSLVVNKMLVAQSEIDSIYVEDAEVNQSLNRRMSVMVQQFGGEAEIEKAYEKSMEQIRSEVFDNIKEQLTIQKMQSELTNSLKVTPAEVRKFFKGFPGDSLPYFPTEVTVAQIVINPKPGKIQRDNVRNLMLDIRSRIENGASFSDLARQYSQDPGSAAKGGQLPFYSRGELAPEYEASVLSMKPGELSMPIETQFGFHLIELQEKRGNTFRSRHILISPQPSPSDLLKSEKYLDSLRTRIVNDSISFQAAAKEYSDDQLTSSAGGFFQDAQSGSLKVPTDQLDPNIFFTIDTMKIGKITQPLKFQQQDGSYAFRILYYKSRIPPHQANLDQDYQRIAAAALSKKQNLRISKWFEQARNNVFIEIDPEYDYCNLTQ